MPREVFVSASVAPTFADLARACLRLDPTLRAVDAGAYWQVLDANAEAVATVDRPRLVADGQLAARVSGGPTTSGEVWWVEALVPWASAADSGVEVLRLLAADCGAQLVVQDGR